MDSLQLETKGYSPLSPNVSDVPITIQMRDQYGIGRPRVWVLMAETQAIPLEIAKFEYGAWITIEQAESMRTWLETFLSAARVEEQRGR